MKRLLPNVRLFEVPKEVLEGEANPLSPLIATAHFALLLVSYLHRYKRHVDRFRGYQNA